MNYTTYVTDLANLLVVPSTDSNYTTALVNIIDDAEQRTYRDLDLLATRITNTAATLSSGVRTVSLSTTLGTFLVVEEANVYTPITASSSNATRVPLTYTSREFIDICYPSNSANTGTPQFWSMASNTTIIVGPSPDVAYPIETVGTIRPTPLSTGNSSTILTQMLPDVFMAASCVFGAAYLKNFGASADDPKSGLSWEMLYQDRLRSAMTEENRKKYRSEAWTDKQPSQAAKRV